MNKAQAKQSYHFDPSRPVLAILGGSQGSKPFNHHFQNHLEQYTGSNIQILWQCGKKDFPALKALNRNQDVHIIPFTEEMDVFYYIGVYAFFVRFKKNTIIQIKLSIIFRLFFNHTKISYSLILL